MAELRKFTFDTVFDSAGDIAFAPPRSKRSYTAEEIEDVRREAYAEGERAALASIEARQQVALTEIAATCRQALPRLAEVAHEHRVNSANLSFACARSIAGAALDLFPEAPLRAALASLGQELEAAPRLTVTAASDLAEGLQERLAELAATIGYAGAIQLKVDADASDHAFTLDFGDGHAAFDSEAAATRVANALAEALAAEGLHGEPLIPGAHSESEG